ncbi:MAG: activator of (R)-2-hydroxyglutaryl-CoA dehydratase [Candidatus Marinimicrobia bacterium]|nr:activator of (R)-2-hydroxyglutaryl-CoA dehydratase [Candidatus Neomarinimicrobiota bacterium]
MALSGTTTTPIVSGNDPTQNVAHTQDIKNILLSKESFVEEKVAEERKRLEEAAGLNTSTFHHFSKPMENLFTRDQRETTTLLFGGMTWRHEHLLEGVLRGLGYKVNAIPTPDVSAFQLGKEYGNNGQCNPTYFTVGSLIQYLQDLESQGLTREEIIRDYLLLTAGACGPCRFGMYEAEYRLALQNSGFEGFRVILFQQSGGLNQSEMEAGLDMNLDFFLGLINAFNMGDILNEVGYKIRPYEVEEGRTNAVMEESLNYLHDVMRDHKPYDIDRSWLKFLSGAGFAGGINYLGKFIDQLKGQAYTKTLSEAGGKFNEIEVDRFRVKPIVKITGEFWAQLTEGDGNFNMFHFLEKENAEVLVEPVGTWVMYLMSQYKMRAKDRKGINEGEMEPAAWRLDQRLMNEIRYRKKIGTMTLAEKVFKREFTRLQQSLGLNLHELVDQYELQRMGHPFYNTRSSGGEGHLEVAKNIYYNSKGLAHMVLSVKPFGCMPSTQSDGAQAAVVELYKDAIYLPIETSGEGEVNAHSRVQMALGNARIKAKQEFQKALKDSGRTLDEMKDYVESHPELKRPMYTVPKRKDIVGTAANFAIHVADLMDGRVQGAA